MNTSEIDPFLAMSEAMGPCACGRANEFTGTREEALELLAIREANPMAAKWASAFSYVCDECERVTLEARQKRADEYRRQKAHNDALRDGLMTRQSLACTFAASRKDIEDRAPGTWMRLRQWRLTDTNLWFAGPEGSGKTYAARCLLNKQLETGNSAAELSAIELESHSHKFDIEEWLQPYAHVELLSIEDIDKARWTAKGIEALWRVLDLRYDGKRRVLVTANVNAQTFFDKTVRHVRMDNPTIGDTLRARLRPSQTVTLDGESLRLAAGSVS